MIYKKEEKGKKTEEETEEKNIKIILGPSVI